MSKPSPETHILIKGARMHNLKNVDVNIPKEQLVVVTGLSGSGKSSLVFDTLYAEGQRRYVESLSSYARQFLGRLDKPDVDSIKGIAPAVAIEQKVSTSNPRSTVGTTTEIYDYLKLLYARIGKTISPISGNEVKKHSVSDVMDFVKSQKDGSKVQLFTSIILPDDRNPKIHQEVLLKQGFSRVLLNGEIQNLNEIAPKDLSQAKLLIDRFVVSDDEDNLNRISDSVQTAFYEGRGECELDVVGEESVHFNNRFELDGMTFEEPSVDYFSFNSPTGACKTCEGYGDVIGIDPDKVIPNIHLSVYEDAIVPWRGEKMSKWKKDLLNVAHEFDFPVHTPIADLTDEEYDLLWSGNKHFKGLDKFFTYLQSKSYKIHYRVMLSRYRGKTNCPDCKGSRIRKDASYVKVGDTALSDLLNLPLTKVKVFFDELKLSEHDFQIAKRLIEDIELRLDCLINVGLGYLSLNRRSNTLSGGESQRIHLATSIGSSLVGSMYILDEPSIGLHPKDTERLISVLKKLKDLGNTVVVVEHDEEIMRSADHILDMGPEAGSHGGELVFAGNHSELKKKAKSLTADYLNGVKKVHKPSSFRKAKKFIELIGARHNNLKNVDAKFPLECMTVVTGVSGSGKSSLVRGVFYPALAHLTGGTAVKPGKHKEIAGAYSEIEAVEFIDQNPIGKSSRSNPATYIKVYDDIRKLFSDQQLSKINGYKPASFSFNVAGGRCDNCDGEGQIRVEMQFMADVFLKCDVCDGKKFKDFILEVKYRDKSIYDVLEMTIDEAIEFFRSSKIKKEQNIADKIQPLQDVGLGYVQLGQASSTLSGGEAQRVKLASFLSKGSRAAKTLFIFDEPTTGLHFHDINKLLDSLNALLANGHTVVIIEHNMEVAQNADWIIDIGPEGGDKGGNIIYQGPLEGIKKVKESVTANYL